MATRKKTTLKKSTKPASKKLATHTKPATRKKSAGSTTASAKKTTSSATSQTKRATPRKKTRSAAEQLTEYQRKRDFKKTAEPSGATARTSRASRAPATDRLVFVIQKHAATRLHYDLRLEIDGVMKSWAVPKGPSADPSVKRLAMQVEDHPVEYNDFEGTIPAGEYGGGTVMLWDHGTYEIENSPDDDMNTAAHDQYERGELKIIFHGKRIKGSYALVRTKGMGGNASKPAWLMIKHRDDQALPESESSLTGKYTKSVTTSRTMDEIGDGNRVWHSSR